MLGSVPFLVLVFGTPLVIVALLPANLLWQRLMRRHQQQLSRLYLSVEDAAALAPRAVSASRACTVALWVGGVLAATLFLWPPTYGDPRLAAVAAPVGAAVALVIVGSWPVQAPAAGRRHALEGRVRVAVAMLVAVTVVLVLACGVVSVRSVPSGDFAAYPRASLTDWYYSFDGIPKDFEWTPHGVTEPWPGWFYGVPVAVAVLALGAITLACLPRLRRWDLPGERTGEDAGEGLLRRLDIVVAMIAGIGLLGALGFVATMAGDVLKSVSLYPKPQLPDAGIIKPYGHTLPEYALGVVGAYSSIVLVPLLVMAAWLAVFATRELRAAVASARGVLRTTS